MSNLAANLGLSWLDRYFGAVTLTSADFVQPAVGSTVTVAVDRASSAIVGQYVFVENGGYYIVSSILDVADIVLQNADLGGNAAPGTTIPSGSAMGPAGQPTYASYSSRTNASHASPAVLSNSLGPNGIVIIDPTGGGASVTFPPTPTPNIKFTLLVGSANGPSNPTSIIGSGNPVGKPGAPAGTYAGSGDSYTVTFADEGGGSLVYWWDSVSTEWRLV